MSDVEAQRHEDQVFTLKFIINIKSVDAYQPQTFNLSTTYNSKLTRLKYQGDST